MLFAVAWKVSAALLSPGGMVIPVKSQVRVWPLMVGSGIGPKPGAKEVPAM